MLTSAVLVIIGMTVGMIFSIVINWMEVNDNLKPILVMSVVKMDEGTDLTQTQNLEN